MLLFIKYTLSAFLVVLVSEAAKRSPGWGGVLASLPLVSILAIIWLWHDTKDPQRLADFALSTFWFVLPSLTLFLLLPLLLRQGMAFPLALALSCLGTGIAYIATAAIARRFGVAL